MEKLEFGKVRQRVMRYAASDAGRQVLAGLVPSCSVGQIRSELACVSETKRLLEEEGDLPLSGIHDVAGVIHKSSVEGALLQARELGEIGSTLRAARLLRTVLV